ncbi:MAG TPA: dethiobiotin synthase [Polyangiaceae bacterium]|nr:dethiobiotin synthase [Polyangiaceae bacterium]
MKNALVVVSGTGTGIGKTHFAEALLLALGATGARAIGYKPIETGLAEATVSDGARLDRASVFHVEPSAYLYGDPISPHLAARQQGEPIDVATIAERVFALRDQADVTVVELAGGLFSPLADETVNADVVQALSPDRTLLVTPDRLGVLHEAIATIRAVATVPLRVDGIVVVEPELGDASTGSNAEELRRLQPVPVVARLPRGTITDLSADPQVVALAAALLR